MKLRHTLTTTKASTCPRLQFLERSLFSILKFFKRTLTRFKKKNSWTNCFAKNFCIDNQSSKISKICITTAKSDLRSSNININSFCSRQHICPNVLTFKNCGLELSPSDSRAISTNMLFSKIRHFLQLYWRATKNITT
jgi:hypothetical protein